MLSGHFGKLESPFYVNFVIRGQGKRGNSATIETVVKELVTGVTGTAGTAPVPDVAERDHPLHSATTYNESSTPAQRL